MSEDCIKTRKYYEEKNRRYNLILIVCIVITVIFSIVLIKWGYEPKNKDLYDWAVKEEQSINANLTELDKTIESLSTEKKKAEILGTSTLEIEQQINANEQKKNGLLELKQKVGKEKAQGTNGIGVLCLFILCCCGSIALSLWAPHTLTMLNLKDYERTED